MFYVKRISIKLMAQWEIKVDVLLWICLNTNFFQSCHHATCMILKTRLLMFCLDFLCRQEQLTLSLQELGGFVRARLEFLMWKHRRHGTLTISALSPLLSWIVRWLQQGLWCRTSSSLHPSCWRLPLWSLRTTTLRRKTLFGEEGSKGEEGLRLLLSKTLPGGLR